MNTSNDFRWVISLSFIALIVLGIAFIVRGMYFVLKWVAPAMLILTLIVRYRVVIRFVKWLLRQYNISIFQGILWTLLVILMYPLVATLLLIVAVAERKGEAMLKDLEDKNERVYDETDFTVLETKWREMNEDR